MSDPHCKHLTRETPDAYCTIIFCSKFFEHFFSNFINKANFSVSNLVLTSISIVWNNWFIIDHSGRHYFLTGGLSGAKEFYYKLLSSVFAYYQVLSKEFIDTNPMMKRLFKKPEYLQAMNKLCKANAAGEYYFRPVQVNVVMITPGQDLPLHFDNGWFWGANRFSLPDWVTVAMTRSGLFEDISIPQAQTVVYLHGSKVGMIKL